MMRIRILIVDDEKLVLSSLRRLLARGEFQVSTACSGAEALALLETTPVDIVLSDYQMPGMNGVEFLERVAPRWPAIRRCMLTAQADEATLSRALESGVLHHAWTKPWDNRKLLEDLRRAVNI